MWWVEKDMSVMVVLGSPEGPQVWLLRGTNRSLAPDLDLAAYDHMSDPSSGLREMEKLRTQITAKGKFIGYLKVDKK